MYNVWQAQHCSNLTKNTGKEAAGHGKAPAQAQTTADLRAIARFGGHACPAVRTQGSEPHV